MVLRAAFSRCKNCSSFAMCCSYSTPVSNSPLIMARQFFSSLLNNVVIAGYDCAVSLHRGKLLALPAVEQVHRDPSTASGDSLRSSPDYAQDDRDWERRLTEWVGQLVASLARSHFVFLFRGRRFFVVQVEEAADYVDDGRRFRFFGGALQRGDGGVHDFVDDASRQRLHRDFLFGSQVAEAVADAVDFGLADGFEVVL